ncbi:hypothetical protein RQP46_004592 [Phenoliferia psychrophenolica]
MSVFRPCIDLHNGQVKQIVGGTLDTADLKTNFVSVLVFRHPPELALADTPLDPPDSLHLGGGITDENALQWLDAGAEKVIVTSYLFPKATFDLERLRRLSEKVEKRRLVVDVSCRRRKSEWVVAMNRWQDLTTMVVNEESLALLSDYSSEFLIHAADVEGLCQGIDEELVEKLGEWSKIPATYAGGARSIDDLRLVDTLSKGRVDLTYGSALDIFGGTQVKFDDLVAYNTAAGSARV